MWSILSYYNEINLFHEPKYMMDSTSEEGTPAIKIIDWSTGVVTFIDEASGNITKAIDGTTRRRCRTKSTGKNNLS